MTAHSHSAATPSPLHPPACHCLPAYCTHTPNPQLTAKEKRQIASSLKHLVRQQSTDLYYKQQDHKETIMRRQAMLAQQHLEQLACRRMEEMMTMSYIAREQSAMLLPAASELLAGLSAQAGQPQAEQHPQQQLQAARSVGSSTSSSSRRQQQQQPVRQPQAWRSRSGSSSQQRLPSVLEQQQQQQVLCSRGCDRVDVVQAVQQRQQQAEGSIAIEIHPAAPFSFQPRPPLPSSWAGGSGQLGGGSTAQHSRGRGSNCLWPGWSTGGHGEQLMEPLLQDGQQQDDTHVNLTADTLTGRAAEEQVVYSISGQSSTQQQQQQDQQQQHPPAALCLLDQQGVSMAGGRGDQPLLLERYLSSSTELREAAAVACCAGSPVPDAPVLSLHSSDSIGSSSSSSDDSSITHQQQQQQQQQQQPLTGLVLSMGRSDGLQQPAAHSRCSCDTTCGDVDTPRRVKAAGRDQLGGAAVAPVGGPA